MATYDIKTLQGHILKILLAVDKVCREHHLRYYCWAGTMLGAVRHKGFIPWDDDMDICMPRPDYDRFMAHAHEWLPKPYEAICPEINAAYPGGFGKVLNADTTLIEREHSDYIGGIYIDVFPIDGVPEARWAQRLATLRYTLLDKLIYFLNRNPYKHGHGPESWPILFLQSLFSRKWAQRCIRQLRLRYPYDESSQVLDYDDGMRGIISKRVLGEPTPVNFEGETVMGVERWDEYLTAKYGDYMTIPPHDDQRQHNFFYLDYELPYRQYHDQRSFTQHHDKQ
jgi:lipopolysaccharide cholinephosphotransferase